MSLEMYCNYVLIWLTVAISYNFPILFFHSFSQHVYADMYVYLMDNKV